MKREEPLLSVVIPVYNSEQYIDVCIKSILMQAYMTMEIILVDDGSSDQSGLICDLLAERNSCIKALHTENRGITRARLAGLKAAVGDWVTFVDADDWVDGNAYEDLVDEKNDCDVIITGICRYFDTEHQIMQMPYLEEGVYDKRAIIKKIAPIMLWDPRLEVWALDPSLCTKIFKREIILEQLEKASEVGSNYGEDSIVIFPLMLQVDKVRILSKIYYYHRQRTLGEIPPYIIDEEFIPKLSKVYDYLKVQFKSTPYWNIMENQLDCFYIYSVNLKKRCYDYLTYKFVACFPFGKIPQNSSVILYGAGEVGKQYWEQNLRYHFCNIVLWVDRSWEKRQKGNIRIHNPEKIKSTFFDYVLIGVDNYYAAREIGLYLKELGVGSQKIVWQSTRINDREIEEGEGRFVS